MSTTSRQMRENDFFMRNNFIPAGKYGFALNRKQDIDLSDIQLIACSDTRPNDNELNRRKGVHHFVDDYRFDVTYSQPEKRIKKYSQYAFLLTPDFSTYADMSLWRQIQSVGMNRWVGAFWQRQGMLSIATVSWSTPRSYEFCFDGIETDSVVAVGMIGCKREKQSFLHGYAAMLEHLSPSAVIVFGSPFKEMKGNIVPVDYLASRKVVR